MDGKEKLAASAALGLVVVLIGVDMAADWQAGTSRGHLLVEGLAAVAAAVGLVAVWARALLAFRRALSRSDAQLRAARAEAARWRTEAAEALQGLSDAIDRQFERWGLTISEKEVAALLLKGLSLKEIATVREVSERTARHQSLAVYRKAGLSGRADLAAFFLEDMLLPVRPSPADTPAEPGKAGEEPPAPPNGAT